MPLPVDTKRIDMKMITTNEMQKANGKKSRKMIILEHWFRWLLTGGILEMHRQNVADSWSNYRKKLYPDNALTIGKRKLLWNQKAQNWFCEKQLKPLFTEPVFDPFYKVCTHRHLRGVSTQLLLLNLNFSFCSPF